MSYQGTREAAKALGVTPNALNRAIWEGRINAPKKGPGGAYFWTERDIEHASWVLLHRPFEKAKGHTNVTANR